METAELYSITYHRSARETIDSYPRTDHRAQIVIDCCRVTDGQLKPLRPLFGLGDRVRCPAYRDYRGFQVGPTIGVVIGFEIHPQLWSPFVRVRVASDDGGLTIGNQNWWQRA